MQKISKEIPKKSLVFLGNSLPIREWDLAAVREDKNLCFQANRGMNGIDGLISTFLGCCKLERKNFLLIGDLSTLYDLSAPWILPQLEVQDIGLILINNGGGKIFSRVFKNSDFENPHHLNFKAFADMWGVAYQQITSPAFEFIFDGPTLFEVRPDQEQTDLFWQGYDKLWADL